MAESPRVCLGRGEKDVDETGRYVETRWVRGPTRLVGFVATMSRTTGERGPGERKLPGYSY